MRKDSKLRISHNISTLTYDVLIFRVDVVLTHEKKLYKEA